MTLKLKGGKELDAFLAAFPLRVQKGAVRAGLTAAAKTIRDEARLRAPRRTGKFAKSIKSGSSRVNRDGTVSIKVRTDSKGNDHAFLGLFFEYGVAPHYIRAGTSDLSPRLLTRAARTGEATGDVSKGALKIGNNFIRGEVLHPGFPARPFMRPALDVKSKQAIEAFADRIQFYLHDKSRFTAPYVEVREAA